MPRVAIVLNSALESYDFGPNHPFRPERVTGAVALMRAYGLLGPDGAEVVSASPATDEELALVHDRSYIQAVRRASERPHHAEVRFGIGTGDDPAFADMHDAAALVVGATLKAAREVIDGRFDRAFSIWGGLHHAHRDHAAGFCIYNDPAIAIADAIARDPGLCVAYIDIDAHHGDGVQEAFWDEPRVLTVSMHQDPRTLFPGTGYAEDTGGPQALGSAVNVPMSPLASDERYRLAFDRAVAPAVQDFAPNLIVAQLGCDAHHDDPLTRLGLTLSGYRDVVHRIVTLADDLCEGRMVVTGGGGYEYLTVVPRAWTIALAILLGRELPEDLTASDGI